MRELNVVVVIITISSNNTMMGDIGIGGLPNTRSGPQEHTDATPVGDKALRVVKSWQCSSKVFRELSASSLSSDPHDHMQSPSPFSWVTVVPRRWNTPHEPCRRDPVTRSLRATEVMTLILPRTEQPVGNKISLCSFSLHRNLAWAVSFSQ